MAIESKDLEICLEIRFQKALTWALELEPHKGPSRAGEVRLWLADPMRSGVVLGLGQRVEAAVTDPGGPGGGGTGGLDPAGKATRACLEAPAVGGSSELLTLSTLLRQSLRRSI